MQRNISDLVFIELNMIDIPNQFSCVDGDLKRQWVILFDRTEELIADIYMEVYTGNGNPQMKGKPILKIFICGKVQAKFFIHINKNFFNKFLDMFIIDSAACIQQFLSGQKALGKIKDFTIWNIHSYAVQYFI